MVVTTAPSSVPPRNEAAGPTKSSGLSRSCWSLSDATSTKSPIVGSWTASVMIWATVTTSADSPSVAFGLARMNVTAPL